MARVLAISTDLLLGSRVEAMLGAAGHEVTLAGSVGEVDPGAVDVLVADLDAVGAGELVGRGLPVLGYYSHVEVATRRAAEAAGVDLVVPRSRMARELPALVAGLLAGR